MDIIKLALKKLIGKNFFKLCELIEKKMDYYDKSSHLRE